MSAIRKLVNRAWRATTFPHDTITQICTGLALLISLTLLAACGGGGSNNSTPPPVAVVPCTAGVGLSAPLPACSAATPCTRVAAELDVPTITTATEVPVCDNAVWNERYTHTVLGFERHACIYRPPGAATMSPRPLLVWFHPGGEGSADLAQSETGLLAKAANYDLSGDPLRPGFILVAVQGRNLRFPTTEPRDGQHHDFYFRDLSVPSTNPDIANADALIDALVQEGVVDTNRIYVSGWSNGGFFSQLYAVARHDTATPGGNRVAAAAVFAAANPFSGITWDPFNETPAADGAACQYPDPPAIDVPIQIVYRTADAAVACDEVQAACFNTEPGYTTSQWVTNANAAGMSLTGRVIRGLELHSNLDQDAMSCTDYSTGCPVIDCDTMPFQDGCLSVINHLRWPDGDYNNPPAGTNRENDMLQFLASHPHP